jgi:hypothetical protein
VSRRQHRKPSQLWTVANKPDATFLSACLAFVSVDWCGSLPRWSGPAPHVPFETAGGEDKNQGCSTEVLHGAPCIDRLNDGVLGCRRDCVWGDVGVGFWKILWPFDIERKDFRSADIAGEQRRVVGCKSKPIYDRPGGRASHIFNINNVFNLAVP